MDEDCGHQSAWELMTEEVLPAKDLLVDTLARPIPEDPLVIMGESLLDCIVKDSPIKEVSSFLTQPTSSLFKTNVCFVDEDLVTTSDVSNMADKSSDQNGNMTDTEQPTESAEMGLTISPDTLDENLDYICTLMQSNRFLKERLKRNLAYGTNPEEVMSCPSPPEIEKMQYQIIKVLRYKLQLQQEELRKKEEIIAWKMHILGRLHLDMKSMHSDLSTRSLGTEENHFNSPYVQKASNLLSKIRSLLALTEGLLSCQDSKTVADNSKKRETGTKQKETTKSRSIKKKTMEEKHKESSEAIQELIIKERPSEGHQTAHEYLFVTWRREICKGPSSLSIWNLLKLTSRKLQEHNVHWTGDFITDYIISTKTEWIVENGGWDNVFVPKFAEQDGWMKTRTSPALSFFRRHCFQIWSFLSPAPVRTNHAHLGLGENKRKVHHRRLPFSPCEMLFDWVAVL